MRPTPLADHILIEPYFDPIKIGSIYMPPAAQNEAPSHGTVRAVGPLQREIEERFEVIVSTVEWVKKAKFEWLGDSYVYLYTDREVIAFLTRDGEVFPRRDRIILRPNWNRSGVVKHGLIYTIDRVFEAPKPPQWGTVLRVGEDVKTIRSGDEVVIPRNGGNELGVKDTVYYSIKEKDIPGIITNAVKDDTPQPARHRAKATRGPGRHR